MTQHKQATVVTRSLQIQLYTPTKPLLSETTRTELARLAESARDYLAVGNLPAAWAVLAGRIPYQSNG